MPDTSPETETSHSVRHNTVRLIRQLQESGEPIRLTVNGQAEILVQDATSYQLLIELVDRIETLEAIRESLKDEAEGRVVRLDEVKEFVRRKHGISV